jgi:hypothetical protein
VSANTPNGTSVKIVVIDQTEIKMDISKGFNPLELKNNAKITPIKLAESKNLDK